MSYDRTVEETTHAVSSYVSDRFSLRVEHALKRYIKLFAQTGMAFNNYVSDDRKSQMWEIGVGIAYRWRDGIEASLRYVYDQRRVNKNVLSFLDDYERSRILLGLSLYF
jgi:outer membrane autotransporter protein